MANNWQQLTLSAATTALAIAAIAPSAQAMSLVPQEEGEVDVGLGCLTTCISLPNLIQSVVSEVDSTTGAQSRLFVDDVDTFSSYGSVNLGQGDIGTSSTGFWYRPVEETEEDGRLEVGTFTFTFKKTLSELMIDFFDAEVGGQTGILAVNGQAYNSFIPNGGNGNIFTETLSDVSSITLKLGADFEGTSGDGVNFRIATVPEPASLLGLGTVAVLGALGLRKRSV